MRSQSRSRRQGDDRKRGGRDRREHPSHRPCATASWIRPSIGAAAYPQRRRVSALCAVIWPGFCSFQGYGTCRRCIPFPAKRPRLRWRSACAAFPRSESSSCFPATRAGSRLCPDRRGRAGGRREGHRRRDRRRDGSVGGTRARGGGRERHASGNRCGDGHRPRGRGPARGRRSGRRSGRRRCSRGQDLPRACRATRSISTKTRWRTAGRSSSRRRRRTRRPSRSERSRGGRRRDPRRGARVLLGRHPGCGEAPLRVGGVRAPFHTVEGAYRRGYVAGLSGVASAQGTLRDDAEKDAYRRGFDRGRARSARRRLRRPLTAAYADRRGQP